MEEDEVVQHICTYIHSQLDRLFRLLNQAIGVSNPAYPSHAREELLELIDLWDDLAKFGWGDIRFKLHIDYVNAELFLAF